LLAQILPGFREIRGPLVSGYLWLLLAWLILHDSIDDASSGAIHEIVEGGRQLPAAVLGAVASFAAYLIGSLSEDSFDRLLKRFAFRRAARTSQESSSSFAATGRA
jgi:hypothetical protein